MMNSTLTSPLQNPSLFSFPLHRFAKPRSKTTPFPRNSFFFVNSFSPPRSLRVPADGVALRLVRCSVIYDKVDKNGTGIHPNSLKRCNDENNPLSVAKPIAYALFYIFIGFFCPFIGFQKPALAAAAAAAATESVVREETKEKGHEYSSYTRRLLEVVSRLLKIIEGAKKAGKEDFDANVREGLKEVKMTRMELQDEIMNGLYAELRVLKEEKEALMDRSEEIVKVVFKLKREQESLMRKTKGVAERIERLRNERRSLEKEYSDLWERIGEIEDLMARKETVALGMGVRELLSIERECEALVERFLREMRERMTQR